MSNVYTNKNHKKYYLFRVGSWGYYLTENPEGVNPVNIEDLPEGWMIKEGWFDVVRLIPSKEFRDRVHHSMYLGEATSQGQVVKSFLYEDNIQHFAEIYGLRVVSVTRSEEEKIIAVFE